MRKLLSGKEIKELLEKLPQALKIFSKKDKLEIFDDLYKLNDIPFLFIYKNQDAKKDFIIPHLKSLQNITNLDGLNVATVDMGAIKFVIGGADIMRPGITNIKGDFQKGDYLIIVEETHKKPISVGIAMLSSDEMINATGGKVIKNIHYVGDDMWKKE
jgi:PUA-domain protein